MNVRAWLEGLGLAEYAESFGANHIDEEVLSELDNEDLKDLGVHSVGHRKRLLAAIRELESDSSPRSEAPAPAPPAAPLVPDHLARRIIESRYALEGERKQVTVLFADIKSSMALIAGADPEYAARIIDPTVEAMMGAVHAYEGTVNRVLGDGIMALFGAPIAHEDHALRACYAALSMRGAMHELSERTRREVGVDIQVRIGLNSGEVVVRSISNDLALNYDAIGETTHLAARMEQLASPGTIRVSGHTWHLVRDFMVARPLGAIPVKGIDDPVECFELTEAGPTRTRIQASAASGLSEFVGRTEEMALLAARLEAARGHRGQVVNVIGEPGLGKSRLYYEFTRPHRMEGCLVLEAASVSHGRSATYLPVMSLMRGYFGIDAGDDARRLREKVTGKLVTVDDSLRRAADPLLHLLGGEVAPDWLALDAAERRRATMEAIFSVLAAESGIQPVVVVLEDLHWLDVESLSFLERLVSLAAGQRMLVLVNCRPEFAESWPGGHCTRVRLDRLEAAETRELLDALLGPAASLEPLKETLAERTDGNPLFLEESVRSLVEAGVLAGSRGAYELADRGVDLETPASVQAVLAARIDRLEPERKRVLQTAAVIGKHFELPLLQAIWDGSPSALLGELSSLQRADFVYETALYPRREYTFKHALTHDVAYRSLVGGRRAALHGRIVAALDALPLAQRSAELERLTHHAAQAGQWEQARQYGIDAGLRLIEHSSNRAALGVLAEALEAARQLPETDENLAAMVDVHLLLRDLYWVLGEPSTLAEHVAAAEALCERIDDPGRSAWTGLQVSGSLWFDGRYEQALARAERVLETALSIGDTELAALVRYRRGAALTFTGEFVEAVAELEAALTEFASPQGRESYRFGGMPFCFSRSFLAWSLAELGELHRAERLGREGYQHACDRHHMYSQGVSAFGLGHALILAGSFGEASRVLGDSLEVLLGSHVSIEGFILPRLAYASARRGDLERARDYLALHRRDPDIMKAVPQEGSNFVWFARAEAALGNTDAALGHLDSAQERASRQGERAVLGWCTVTRAELALAAGRLESARGAFGSALEVARAGHYQVLEAHAHLGLARAAAERSEACEHARHAHALATACGIRDVRDAAGGLL